MKALFTAVTEYKVAPKSVDDTFSILNSDEQPVGISRACAIQGQLSTLLWLYIYSYTDVGGTQDQCLHVSPSDDWLTIHVEQICFAYKLPFITKRMVEKVSCCPKNLPTNEM